MPFIFFVNISPAYLSALIVKYFCTDFCSQFYSFAVFSTIYYFGEHWEWFHFKLFQNLIHASVEKRKKGNKQSKYEHRSPRLDWRQFDVNTRTTALQCGYPLTHPAVSLHHSSFPLSPEISAKINGFSAIIAGVSWPRGTPLGYNTEPRRKFINLTSEWSQHIGYNLCHVNCQDPNPNHFSVSTCSQAFLCARQWVKARSSQCEVLIHQCGRMHFLTLIS